MSRGRGVTPAVVRRLALALPEVTEGSHFEQADFRVRQKIFATLRKDGRTVGLKTSRADLDALVSMDSQTFSDSWRGQWVSVRLDRVTKQVMRDLLADAWRLVAPKRLASGMRESGG